MYEKKTLPNGVRILTEHVPGVRSVSLGIWVGTGSRHESAGENGAAHFIEHMLFKGTRSRTAAQLAEEMDAVGGQINAFTTKECTCFYARVLDTHLARAADILCDMFFHSRFDDAEVETERGVILEEIGMSIEDLEENTVALGEEIDAISDDLSDVEKAVFDEDDDDDDCCCGDEEDDFFEVDCPNCGDTLMIDESVLEEGVIQCPGCRQKFALDLSDDCCCGDGDEDGCGCGCEEHDHD